VRKERKKLVGKKIRKWEFGRVGRKGERSKKEEKRKRGRAAVGTEFLSPYPPHTHGDPNTHGRPEKRRGEEGRKQNGEGVSHL